MPKPSVAPSTNWDTQQMEPIRMSRIFHSGSFASAGTRESEWSMSSCFAINETFLMVPSPRGCKKISFFYSLPC